VALKHIASQAVRFIEAIAAVTGIDAEMVDSDLARVAGTGIYAAGVGKTIEPASAIYRTALRRKRILLIENPRHDPICHDCPDQAACQEKLTLCAPIAPHGEVLGVIGLVCFTDADRQRVLDNREMYTRFIDILTDALGHMSQREQNAREDRQRLDAILEITDHSGKGVLVLDTDHRVVFINDAAKAELGLAKPDPRALKVAIEPTGESYSSLDEFEIVIAPHPDNPEAKENRQVVLGRLAKLRQKDPLFHQALAFESKPSLTAMLSSLGGASDNNSIPDAIVGESQIIRNLKAKVRKIAASPSTVLITGESGVGKEMFARAIHAASPRSGKPFVAINCGAIPDALLESEFFGYARGAFTSASPSGRMGKFEVADGGILFLDEIGSLPLHMQVKLLRAIQERSFTRLGSNRMLSVDIRIIAATNDRLPDLIRQRMFREDLYYRLNVIPLELPPLREHKDDIPALAEYFLDRYCRLFDKPPLRLSPLLLAHFMAYDWPGNIREFENSIEYMVNMHQGGELTAAALPPRLSRPPGSAARQAASESSRRHAARTAPSPSSPAILPLAEIEQEAIRNALRHFGDSPEGKKLAAKALGIGIATLYRKIRNY
jgi:transcriptional regulator with PAS, ATPase and Fis domain